MPKYIVTIERTTVVQGTVEVTAADEQFAADKGLALAEAGKADFDNSVPEDSYDIYEVEEAE